MEILMTSFDSFLAGDRRLMAATSLLMFPIYGLGVFLRPIGELMDTWLGDRETIGRRDRLFRHGVSDMVLIFTAEYLFGSLLRSAAICPWNYAGRFFSVDGLIRLDFAPCWFAAGLIFERICAERAAGADG